MENQGYVVDEDEDTRVSLRRSNDMAHSPEVHVTSASVYDLPPGEEIIEPVIVSTTAAEAGSIFDVARKAKQRSRSPDVSRGRIGDGYLESDLRRNDDNRRDSRASMGSRPHSSQSNTRKKSPSPAIMINDEPNLDDGFPWNPPKRSSYSSTIEMDATSVTMHHDMRTESRCSSIEDKAKDQQCRWFRRVYKTLQDNKAQTQEALLELMKLDRMQDTHFRQRKKVMNGIFMAAGVILLLAVIVLIIYTDPQFNESMKALTVFLAGRRQGIW